MLLADPDLLRSDFNRVLCADVRFE